MSGALVGTPAGPVRRVFAGLRWYVREVTGDARYDRYAEQCRAAGHQPPSRAAYERARVDHRERHPEGRCC